MEAHMEGCEECFLRVAAGAADLPEPDRSSLHLRSTPGSPLTHSLMSLAKTQLADARDPSAPEWSRQAIGPYLVTGLLGMGGMSVVYRARHQATGREVAIKTVKMPFVASYLAMLRQEIEFLREAQHPAIVTVLDSDLTADDPWYAMELFEEPTLQEYNRRLWHGSAPSESAPPEAQPPAAGGRVAEVLRLFARLCDPVAFLHAAGMVHGDIKPSNVFLRGHEQPVLMDFGLAARAKGTVGRETLDVTGRIRGTLPYIAPEIIRGKLPDARADLYAIGCMLYESLVGSPPFASKSGTRIIDMHLSVAPTPASKRVRDVPAKVDELLQRLLAKNPAERFGHASALAASLSSIAESLAAADDAVAPELLTSIVVSSEKATPLFRPPLVGRQRELDAILDGVHEARERSTANLILLAGESGIGKTFLTAEVAQRALLEGVEVITSECLPSMPTRASAGGGAAPLQGFRRFFETLRDRCHERGPAEVERLFGDRLVLLADYVPALRYLDRQPERPTPPLPASAARERIVEAVLDTLCAYASRRPLLMALDDLQWADDLTLAVLERLDEELPAKVPLVVLGTYRSDEASEPIRRLGAKSSTKLLHLGRLTKSDTGAMVSGMLSMPAVPEALTEYVHDHAEGVPFFAAEYLRALVAAGALAYRGGAWSLRTAPEQRASEWLGGTLPRTLQELIRDRLDRLSRDGLEVLEAGAVLGRRFSLSRVGRMMERALKDLAPQLASSTAAEIIRSDGFDELTFVHDKIRETLYAGLSSERKTRLHLAAARALDDGDATPPDQLGNIGHHLKDGGEIRRAVDYLERAGTHALRMGANGDAEHFFREVIDLESRFPAREPALRRARWHREHADAFQGLGMMAECAASLKESAALLGRPFPSTGGALAGQLTREVVRQFQHRLSGRLIQRPREEEAAANDEVVRVFDRMHQASWYLGNDGDLVLSTTVSLNASERAGTSPALTVAYSNAAMMAAVLPIQKLADKYFRLAGGSNAASPDPAANAWLLSMEGAYRTWLGDRPRALTCLDRALELWAERGFLRRLDEAECMRTGLDLFAGMHAPALARLDALEPRARKRRDLQIQCWTILQRAEALAVRGEYAGVLEQVARTGPLLPSVSRPERIWATTFESYVRQQEGDHDAAFRFMTEALALIDQGPPVHSHCVTSYNRLAETAVAMAKLEPPGKRRRAYVAAARRAFAIVKRASRIFPIAKPAAALSRGLLDLSRGRSPAVVARRWEQAIAAAETMALPFQELRLRVAILSVLDKDDARREDQERRARALIRALDLEPFEAAPLPADWGALRAGVKVERELELSRS